MTRMSFHTKDYDSMRILVQKNQEPLSSTLSNYAA